MSDTMRIGGRAPLGWPGPSMTAVARRYGSSPAATSPPLGSPAPLGWPSAAFRPDVSRETDAPVPESASDAGGSTAPDPTADSPGGASASPLEKGETGEGASVPSDDGAAAGILRGSGGATEPGRDREPPKTVSHARDNAQAEVSRETATDGAEVSRETTLPSPASETPEQRPPTSPAAERPASITPAAVSRTGPDVSRGTARVLTASDIAALPAPLATGRDTPLATATELALRARGTRRTAFPRPGQTRIIVVANQKGGVGKTTSAVNLAAALALYGARVLLIDLDPQGNASTALGVEHHVDVASMYDVLVHGEPMADVVVPAQGVDRLWCAPATIDLSGAEVELVSAVARENRLRRALTTYLADPSRQGDQRYDYVFIDCPPSLGLITVNALAAAIEVLIPIQCEYYALEGFSQLLTIVDLVRSQLNPGLAVSTVLLTMYDGRTRLASQVADEVRAHFGGTVLSTVIPRSVRVSEAPSYSQTVMTYDPGSTGALSYLEAARELATRHQLSGEAAPQSSGDATGAADRTGNARLEESA